MNCMSRVWGINKRPPLLLAILSPLLLCACAPREQAYVPTPTAQVALDEQAFHMADGASLPYRHWLPHGRTKAIVIALHGFNDYSRAFEYTGRYFSAHGVAVYAYDQRGFGEAQQVGIWANQENLVGDLKQCVQQVQEAHPKTPIYILGESMGGAIAIVALAEPDFPKIQGVILSAPAVWGAETMNPVYRGTLWLAAHTIPYHELTGSDLKIIASSNIPMLRAMSHDPLIIKSTRIDTIYGLVHLMDHAYQDVSAIHTPTLLLYGAQDQVIPPTPVARARERFPEPITYAYYPDGFHMLLRDMDRELVLRDALSWIRRPNAPLPSGFEE